MAAAQGGMGIPFFPTDLDRHVWIYRENPKGVFTPLTPAVRCANH